MSMSSYSVGNRLLSFITALSSFDPLTALLSAWGNIVVDLGP
jgi:hypothetical protein